MNVILTQQRGELVKLDAVHERGIADHLSHKLRVVQALIVRRCFSLDGTLEVLLTGEVGDSDRRLERQAVVIIRLADGVRFNESFVLRK